MPVFYFAKTGYIGFARIDMQKKRLEKKRTSRIAKAQGQAGASFFKEVAAQVMRLAEPLCESEGIELVHVEHQLEQSGRTLRLYIDKPGGVTLDDCAAISRQLGDILDVNLEAGGFYHLEVSSPGPERPLGKKQDYERFKGKTVKIRTLRPVNDRRSFRGVLMGVTQDVVTVVVNGEKIDIPFAEIARGRLTSNNGENGC